MNKPLRQEILSMANKDQEMRTSGTWNAAIDIENTKRLKEIVKEYGWPDRSIVGVRASHMAWLLAQHAVHDVIFQEKCLRLMKQKAKKNLVKLSELAYLTDRIRVRRGKKQLYGTQFYTNDSKALIPRPISSMKNIDARRKSVGLGSFESYKKRLVKISKSLYK